jgi:NADH-quinone oxidoreductase subunit E
MTQPLAGAAVLGALGIGMATQAFGLWLTAMSSAMQGAARGAQPASAPEPAKTPPPAPSAAPVADAKVVKFVSKAERAERAATARKRKPMTAAAPARAAVKAPKKADDLKAISGVGPKLEIVLNGLGIRSYAQVAALTADEIASIEDQLGFKGRIVRDDWAGQAKALMKGAKA